MCVILIYHEYQIWAPCTLKYDFFSQKVKSFHPRANSGRRLSKTMLCFLARSTCVKWFNREVQSTRRNAKQTNSKRFRLWTCQRESSIHIRTWPDCTSSVCTSILTNRPNLPKDHHYPLIQHRTAANIHIRSHIARIDRALWSVALVTQHTAGRHVFRVRNAQAFIRVHLMRKKCSEKIVRDRDRYLAAQYIGLNSVDLDCLKR